MEREIYKILKEIVWYLIPSSLVEVYDDSVWNVLQASNK
jgi:hypothetical protein